MSISLVNKTKKSCEEKRKQLYALFEELQTTLVGDYSDINITNDTIILYICSYDNCNEVCEKQYRTLIKNKLAYCHTHHYLLHNSKINRGLRIQNQEKYNKYNSILDALKTKYPHVNLTWDRDTIWSQAELTFNCINPKCRSSVCKLFQHILQNEEIINEVYFGCDDCKFYISESLREGVTLLINTPQYNELVEYPKQIDYITTHSSIDLIWRCGNRCMNCNSNHTYISSPHYRFVQWGLSCPVCLEPNKCNCINDGFICCDCNTYFPDKKNKIANTNMCKPCKSSKNDDNLEKIFTRMVQNCIQLCKKREGPRCNMNLDTEYLKELYELQNGLCCISKIKMSLKVHSDFKISIERIDESNGYIKGNVCFICIEFQCGQRQWTPEKFAIFCNNYYSFQPITETDIEIITTKCKDALIKNTKHFKQRKTQQNPYNNLETKECLCRTCDTIKGYDEFSEYGIKNGRCKGCHKILNDKRKTPSLRLKLNTLVSSSKRGIESRNESKWRKETPLTHTLTFEELLDVYLQQTGRCAYSNKQLELNGEYMMSLERKDVKIGYTKDNCCLICIEFNTTDWSIAKCDDDNRTGSSGWNKEKLKTVVDNYFLNL
jgi:hypothetical protein